jgi:hypothetical protein
MWGGGCIVTKRSVCVLSEHCALISDRFVRFVLSLLACDDARGEQTRYICP